MNRYVYSKYRVSYPPLKDWRIANYMASPAYMGILLMVSLALGLITRSDMPVIVYAMVFVFYLYGKVWGYRHRHDTLNTFVVSGQIFDKVSLSTAKHIARYESEIDEELYRYFRDNRQSIMKSFAHKWLDTLTPERYEAYRCGEINRKEVEYRVFTYWLDYLKYGYE